MNRQERRQMERDIKKMSKNPFVRSNPSFSTMEEELSSFHFQKQPILYSGVINESITKIKTSPCLVFDNNLVRAEITPEKTGLEINLLMVYPEYLSQGYGKLMLDFLLVKFRLAEIDHVSLYPQKKNPDDKISLSKCQKSLEKFYSKRGFEWNKRKTEMIINWEKFEIYAKTNKVIENLNFERILNPIGVTIRRAA